MAPEALIARYGLLAVFAGAGIEGEAVVLTGGVLAQRGLLPIWGVALAAAAGSCLIDQIWFWLGRRYREHPWVQKARARPAFDRVLRALERYPKSFILLFRFVYGLRTVSPVAVGTSSIPARVFVPLNMLAALIWGPAVAWAGYAFGDVAEPWLRDIKTVAVFAVAILLTVPLLFFAVRWVRSR